MDIDRGSQANPAVADLYHLGATIHSRAWKTNNHGLFTKEDFRVQLRHNRVVCPNGASARITAGGQAFFDSKDCGRCKAQEPLHQERGVPEWNASAHVRAREGRCWSNASSGNSTQSHELVCAYTNQQSPNNFEWIQPALQMRAPHAVAMLETLPREVRYGRGDALAAVDQAEIEGLGLLMELNGGDQLRCTSERSAAKIAFVERAAWTA